MKTYPAAHLAFLITTGLLAGFNVHASTLATHPYNIPGSSGIFAMASAGATTGDSVSPTGPTNYGVRPGSSQITLMTGTSPQSASASYATTLNNTAASSAAAEYGLIRISSTMFNGDAIPSTTVAAYADAGFFETLTISGAPATGTPGQLTLILHVDGTLFGGLPNGSALVRYSVVASTGTPLFTVGVSGSADLLAGTEYSETISQNHLVTLDFLWGESFEVMVRASDRATLRSLFGGLPAGSLSDIQFQNTVYWGGIQSVTANGSPVSSYDLTSASGTSYRNSFAPSASVPEAGTAGIWCIGIAAMAGWRRRRAG